MPYYAVANGHTTGIFNTWAECAISVKGFTGAKYKKFENKADAETFVEEGKATIVHTKKELEPIDYYVYTDGACSNNGKENANAGIGIFFGADDSRNVSLKIEGKQTNNTAELTAILQTYPIIEQDLKSHKHIAIVTDSEYAMKCVSSYGKKCESENWSKDIPNKELVKQVYNTYKDIPNICFIYVKAHTGKDDVHSIGNEGADSLANQAIGLKSCPYSSNTNPKIYLKVDFSQKEHAKVLGGKWDPSVKKWYIYDCNPHKQDVLSIFTIDSD